MTVITEPGVYGDIPDAEYHADPVSAGSLSHSGARDLLPPSCPAKFAYARGHGRKPKKEWDIGHAAHKLVLGVGAELVPVAATDWRTKAAKEQRDTARAEGKTPVLVEQYEQVQRMADAVRAHPLAGELFDTDHYAAVEQSIFWQDQEFGVWRRARIDSWCGARLVDYKTTTSAAPEHVAKSIHSYGYHMQAAWYLDAVDAVDEPAEMFLLVFQETTPPYLVTVVQPDDTAVHIGRQLNRRALEIYRDCTDTGVWPGYTDGIELVGLPGWAERDHLNDIERWETEL